MGIVGDGDRVVTVHHLDLLLIDILAMPSDVLCPLAIDECLVENTQVFLCCQRVAADDVALSQAPHHPDVAVVVREYIGHHGCTLRKGHITQHPVELVHITDGQHRRFWTDLVKSAEFRWCEF